MRTNIVRSGSRIVLPLLISAVIYLPVSAGTSIDQGTAIDIEIAGLNEAAEQIQDLSDNFGPAFANAYALSNISGYPLGSAHLGSFPHLFAGISINAGLANMQYFDSEADTGKQVYPAFALNPVFYFGLGFSKKVDIMGKVMLFSDGFYRPPLDFEYASLSKMNLYSIGGKIRYNAVSKKTILPGLFSLGGVTLSGGADLLYGIVGVEGSYTYTLEGIEVDVGLPLTKQINVDFDPSYDLEISWFMVSLNAQALVYFDIFWIFTAYTGIGVVGTYGSFDMNISGSGEVTTDDSDYITNQGTDIIGTISALSDNKYNPYMIIPVYTVGFDINLFLIHLALESMVNLRNGSDVNVQLGARLQF